MVWEVCGKSSSMLLSGLQPGSSESSRLSASGTRWQRSGRYLTSRFGNCCRYMEKMAYIRLSAPVKMFVRSINQTLRGAPSQLVYKAVEASEFPGISPVRFRSERMWRLLMKIASQRRRSCCT
jgi:hypothetical protein